MVFLLAFGLPCAGGAAPPQEEQEPTSPPPLQLNFDVTLGGVIRDITNGKSSKFQLGRAVPRGFFLRNFFFGAERPPVPKYSLTLAKCILARQLTVGTSRLTAL